MTWKQMCYSSLGYEHVFIYVFLFQVLVVKVKRSPDIQKFASHRQNAVDCSPITSSTSLRLLHFFRLLVGVGENMMSEQLRKYVP